MIWGMLGDIHLSLGRVLRSAIAVPVSTFGCWVCNFRDVPSGKHTKNYKKTMEHHHFKWENPLFLWQFSIAMLNYQRVTCYNLFQQLFFMRSRLHGGNWRDIHPSKLYIYIDISCFTYTTSSKCVQIWTAHNVAKGEHYVRYLGKWNNDLTSFSLTGNHA